MGIGLIGTMIVIQPSFEIFGAVSLLPLATAVTFAIYLILNRKYGAKESPLVMQFYAGVGGWMLAGVVMIFGTVAGLGDLSFGLPHGIQPWLLLLLLGTIGTVSHLMVVQAFKLAPASMLAPFQYLEIVNAVLVGLIVFGDFPTPSKWCGIAIIVGSGFYVFMRERRVKVDAVVEAELERFQLKRNRGTALSFYFMHYPTQNRFALLLEMLYFS